MWISLLQPFAWESREFLRKKLVGKDISFVVEYKVPSGREFGTIFLGAICQDYIL